MSISEQIESILSDYAKAQGEPFTGHPLASKIRRDLPEAIRNALPSEDALHVVKGSAGQSRWVRSPWVAIFNRLVTESAQKGFYPVYLFAEDMSSVYLSLNQAMTEAKTLYNSDAKTALRARAQNFRAMLGDTLGRFSNGEIDLRSSQSSNDSAFYEAGNICSVRYPSNGVPEDATLVADLFKALDLYALLIEKSDSSSASQDGSDEDTFEEGGGPPRAHFRIERNRKLVAKVKALKGSRCETCKMAFGEKYGPVGEGYIEVHHKIPFSEIKGTSVPLNPRTDFAVLCSNCHRMIHKLGDPADLAALTKIVRQ